MVSDAELLLAYGQEMDLHGALTLKDLIDSHRRLRAEAMKTNEERQAEVQRGFSAGLEMGKQQALTFHYLSREDLRKMTLADLSSILFED